MENEQHLKICSLTFFIKTMINLHRQYSLTTLVAFSIIFNSVCLKCNENIRPNSYRVQGARIETPVAVHVYRQGKSKPKSSHMVVNASDVDHFLTNRYAGYRQTSNG